MIQTAIAYCYKGAIVQYIHTCYRVLDLDRSVDFYTNKLGLELAREVPIGDDATNAFLAAPTIPSPAWS
jgi:lactoylglutathione lyase